MAVTNKAKEQQRLKELESSDRYYYNKEADKYIVYIKHLSKNVIIPGEVHRGIVSAYSGFDQRSVEEICTTYNLPQAIFGEYRSIFGLSRDSIPLSAEEVLENSVEESVEALAERKKFEISQKFNKVDWAKTQELAKKWAEFEAKVYDPFVKFLASWKPPVYKPYVPLKNSKTGYSLMVFSNDTHVGASAKKNSMFRGEEQNTQYVVKALDSYANRIIQDVKDQNLNINSLVINLAGDLIHVGTPFGTTTKGTQLRYDMLGLEMFNAAFDAYSNFVYKLSKIAPKVKVYSVPGNHAGLNDCLLAKALSIFFKDQKHIEFVISEAPIISFREKNMLCLATHGAHDSIKAKMPVGAKLKSTVQSSIIYSQENMKGIKARAFFAADLHHAKMEEFNDFNYYLLPSLMRGDNFADAINAYSRPCQQTFLVDDNGIKSVNNYYFD